MTISRTRLSLNLFLLITICFFSYLVATRDLSLFSDVENYQDYFENVHYFKIDDTGFEIGYYFLNLLINNIVADFTAFLFLYHLLINFIYIKCLHNYIKDYGNSFYALSIVLFVGLTLYSSWYNVATLNGLRQGLSLACLYLALSYLYIKANKRFLLFTLLSVSFHYSSFLILPFLIAIKLSFRKLFLIFLIITAFYPLGLNELIISVASNITNIPLHESIANYAAGENQWKGFQLIFYIYSLFWCLVFSTLYYVYFKENKLIRYILKLYLILTCVYFVFGFGPYSNRFGFMAWLLLPLIQTLYIVNFLYTRKLNKQLMLLIFLYVLISGMLNYFIIIRPL